MWIPVSANCRTGSSSACFESTFPQIRDEYEGEQHLMDLTSPHLQWRTYFKSGGYFRRLRGRPQLLRVRRGREPDADLAAISFQHGIRTLCSSERDFRKFARLDVGDQFSET
jgi:hypothetical protein